MKVNVLGVWILLFLVIPLYMIIGNDFIDYLNEGDKKALGRAIAYMITFSAFVVWRHKSRYFLWELLFMVAIVPIIMYIIYAPKTGPPIFDHLLPVMVAFVLLALQPGCASLVGGKVC